MEMTLKTLKQRWGAYPPSDFSDRAATKKFWIRAFPQATEDPPTAEQIGSPAEALVFWLSGFSPDPQYPLTGSGRKTPFFEFDPKRLVDLGDGHIGYVPRHHLQSPYVYFNHRTYSSDSFKDPRSGRATGVARPYKNEHGEFHNPESFQLLSAGLDDDYGAGGVYPTGEGFIKGDVDNLSNLSGHKLGEKFSAVHAEAVANPLLWIVLLIILLYWWWLASGAPGATPIP